MVDPEVTGDKFSSSIEATPVDHEKLSSPATPVRATATPSFSFPGIPATAAPSFSTPGELEKPSKPSKATHADAVEPFPRKHRASRAVPCATRLGASPADVGASRADPGKSHLSPATPRGLSTTTPLSSLSVTATPADPSSVIHKELPTPILGENNGGNNDPEDEPRPPESKWVISIEKEIRQARQDNEARSRAKHSIYRIPHNLKDGRGKAYVPHIVSLGPYHHGNKHLRQMNQHKWRCLDSILRRTNKKIDLYLDSVEEVEERARACYEGPISMSSEEFVKMMVLDGCFVTELLQGYPCEFPKLGYPPNDPVFSMRGLIYTIRRDMIMLENQIPLFILDRLLGVQLGHANQTGLVAKLAQSFFAPLTPTDDYPVERETIQGKSHCLEVFRECLLCDVPKPGGTNGLVQRRHQLIQCVMDLRKAGVKFRKRKTGMFWDIQFKDGILYIPPLAIHDGTRSLFLNLIAFEQCHVNCGNAITSYVFFMDNLINSLEDVGHLFDHGIIEHWLGSHTEVADLFNLLCKEVVIKDSYLSEVTQEVDTYSSHKRHRWMASLKHNYFSNPWSIISFVAALVLLVLTLAQTFFAIYGYFRPRS